MKNKRYFILIPLFCIWLIASLVIAYQGQFISDYHMHVRGMTQQEYQYPTEEIIGWCCIYGIWLLTYVFLFCSTFAIKKPYLSYILCSIIPIIFPLLSFVWAMHAPPYLMIFIICVWLTTIIHFLILPILIPIYRKYIYPKPSQDH